MKAILKVTAIAVVCTTVGLVAALPAQEQEKPLPKPTFEKDVDPFAKKYCAPCHYGERATKDYRFPDKWKEEDAKKMARHFRQASRRVERKNMPPKDSPQPTENERKQFLQWIKDTFPPRREGGGNSTL